MSKSTFLKQYLYIDDENKIITLTHLNMYDLYSRRIINSWLNPYNIKTSYFHRSVLFTKKYKRLMKQGYSVIFEHNKKKYLIIYNK